MVTINILELIRDGVLILLGILLACLARAIKELFDEYYSPYRSLERTIDKFKEDLRTIRRRTQQ